MCVIWSIWILDRGVKEDQSGALYAHAITLSCRWELLPAVIDNAISHTEISLLWSGGLNMLLESTETTPKTTVDDKITYIKFLFLSMQCFHRRLARVQCSSTIAKAISWATVQTLLFNTKTTVGSQSDWYEIVQSIPEVCLLFWF